MEVHVRKKQFLAVELDTVRDADIAHIPVVARGTNRLPHRLLSANALQNRVRTGSIGQLVDASDAFFTVGQAPASLLKACSRLMELLDTPEDIPFLSHLIQREIFTATCELRKGRDSGLLQRRATSATERRERSPG
jgi:hypothetical protein